MDSQLVRLSQILRQTASTMFCKIFIKLYRFDQHDVKQCDMAGCFVCFLAHLSRRLKVRYCDHSPSVGGGGVGGGIVVRPSTIFKQISS